MISSSMHMIHKLLLLHVSSFLFYIICFGGRTLTIWLNNNECHINGTQYKLLSIIWSCCNDICQNGGVWCIIFFIWIFGVLLNWALCRLITFVCIKKRSILSFLTLYLVHISIDIQNGFFTLRSDECVFISSVFTKTLYFTLWKIVFSDDDEDNTWHKNNKMMPILNFLHNGSPPYFFHVLWEKMLNHLNICPEVPDMKHVKSDMNKSMWW